MIDYSDPEVVARQNVAPNAGCDIDGVFYDVLNCVHEISRLRGLIARYSLHVIHNEGTDFLHDVHHTGEITKKEMSEICEYQEALK